MGATGTARATDAMDNRGPATKAGYVRTPQTAVPSGAFASAPGGSAGTRVRPESWARPPQSQRGGVLLVRLRGPADGLWLYCAASNSSSSATAVRRWSAKVCISSATAAGVAR